ncbi:MAG: adenylate/guanylate cyclase domain-containing protein [Halobacteriovoraceae bacterium]|nr:adenylate/guanylate cyclase domain-containing protein [Halobacteriovoraceae bacterium]MBT5093141.1 adenylate/guanylate cyclase domain-containing protein [Halobacteriovoraceae bacterium]
MSTADRLNFFTAKYPNPFDNSKNITYKGAYEFLIECPLDLIFKTISNTSLVNKKLQVPRRLETEIDGHLFIKTKFLGFIPTYWEEYPWRWVFGRHIIANREHHVGAMKNEHAVFHFERGERENQHRVTFYYEVAVKSRLLKFLLNSTFNSFGKKIEKVVRELVAIQSKHQSLIKGIGEHAHRASKRLINAGIEKPLAELMGQLIYQADDDEVYRIQLPKLVTTWGYDLDTLIDNFLIASKAGFFEICWDVLCPHCKGTRSRNNELEDLLQINHCTPCALTFELNDIDIIDVTFKISPSLREVQNISYCAGEPFKKQHILFQDELELGEKIKLEFELPESLYRLRIIGKKENLIFSSSDSVGKEFEWDGLSSATYDQVGNKIVLSITNGDSTKSSYVFESLSLPPYYLSPLHIFNNIKFRKLYKNEKLSDGVQLKLPDQIILFTDVVDSTKFYAKVGDKEAYRQINEHFKIIQKHIFAKKGIIIKTIGDCVMATLRSLDDVIEISRAISQEIKESSDIDFTLRYSVHQGQVIAVNFNTGIDYFGNNVNISAKLQAISNSNELSLSSELYQQLQSENSSIQFEKRTYLGDRDGFVMSIN